MIALQISDMKIFTSGLFVKDWFDAFPLYEASFLTAGSVTIDGRRNMDYYSTEDKELTEYPPYLTWQEAKPLAFQTIKGKRLPLRFRIVLMSAKQPEDADLLLHIRYDQGKLMVVTGVNYHDFTRDKEREHAWDEEVLSFFRNHEIAFEQI